MGRPLNPEHLQAVLQQPEAVLDPLYLVIGDEALLQIETLDLLREAAIQQGYTQRSSLTLDARSDWSAVTAALQSTSLFGDRRLVDLRLPSGKPGRNGSEVLVQLAGLVQKNQLNDTVVLISLPRLDAASRKSKWASALLGQATEIAIPTIERTRLPAWIGARLAGQNQQLDTATLEWMADKVEGNLLAAHQEIQKLGLLYPEGSISPEQAEAAVLNVARYNVFGLRDAMLAGHPQKALAILFGLKAEGEALPLVLWATGDEVRLLARLAQAAAGTQAAEMRQNRVFGQREQLLRQALARVPQHHWPAIVQHAHDIDRLIKGLSVPGRLNDPWEELARLILRVAVSRQSPGP